MIGSIKLTEGIQTVEVINITKIIKDGFESARKPEGLKPAWFGMNYSMTRIEGLDEVGYYIVAYSDEYGDPRILCGDGDLWPVFFADLAINLCPPSVDEAKEVYADLLERDFGGKHL